MRYDSSRPTTPFPVFHLLLTNPPDSPTDRLAKLPILVPLTPHPRHVKRKSSRTRRTQSRPRARHAAFRRVTQMIERCELARYTWKHLELGHISLIFLS